MKSEICLIRHGITEGNQKTLYYGATDIPLAEEGREELANLRDEGVYPEYQYPMYYTSGMIRTEETLQIIFGEQPHQQIELLKEYDFGEFEMRHHRDMKTLKAYQEFNSDRTGDVAPPSGESLNEFKLRIHQGFNELKVNHYEYVLSIRNQEKMAATVAVIHGGPIAAVMNELWPDEKDNFFAWLPDPGHGYRLILEDGGFIEYEEF